MNTTPETKIVEVTFDLTAAWETWTVEVPIDATPAEIQTLLDNGVGDLTAMIDSGNSSMTLVEIDGENL